MPSRRPAWRYRLLSGLARPALWLWVAAVALSIARGRAGDGVPAGWRAAFTFTAQRLGYLPRSCHRQGLGSPPAVDPGDPAVDVRRRRWLHAASVGEVITALPLLQALDALGYPLLVTTATPTGAAVLAARGPARVRHRFLPIDTPGAVARFLERERPASGWIVETELWPTLYAAAANRQVPLSILSARLSARTLEGAGRWLRPVYATALQEVRVLARSEADAERFRTLGAVASSVSVPGDLKRAWSPSPADGTGSAEPPALLHGRRFALAASTHDGEELALAVAWLARPGNELLVIVPRHPNRASAIERDLIEALADRTGRIRIALHSRGETPDSQERLLLGDTFGELERWYRAASCAFIGGSLVPHGGHNLLEAARHALPLCTGPHTHNFCETVNDLRAADALQVLDTAEAVADWLLMRLRAHDAGRADPAGRRARDIALRDAGTLQRYLTALLG